MYHNFAREIAKLTLRKGVGPADIRECVKFFRTAYGKRNLMASMRRGGTNYLMLMLNLAFEISNGSPGEYRYENKLWVTDGRLQTAFDFRTPMNKTLIDRNEVKRPDRKIIFHTHEPARNLLNMKRYDLNTIILVRNIYDQLFSYLFHMGFGVDGEKDFMASKWFDYPFKFYNEWGEVSKERNNFQVLKYEDMAADPAAALRKVSDHFDLGFSDEAISKTAAMTTKEEMAKRIPKEVHGKNPRLSVRSKDMKFSQETANIIRDKIHKELKYHFGYDYD